VRSRWRSSFAVKLAIWWVGYAALTWLLPGAQTGWAAAVVFLGAVVMTTVVMTLIDAGPRALARTVTRGR
jgi:hypothetical protein